VKPRIFIGSSVESLQTAYAVQRNLEFDADLEVWTQDIFKPSQYPIESLMETAKNSDFAVFVFTPHDKAWIRGSTHEVVRDNVLFETGLFVGRLGRERCFILVPRDLEFHIPSDLNGLTPITYSVEQANTNPTSALGAACSTIRGMISNQPEAVPASIATLYAHVKDSPQFSGLLAQARSDVMAIGPNLLFIATNCHDEVFDRAKEGVSCKFLVTADSHSDSAFELIQQYGSVRRLKAELQLAHDHFRDWLLEAEQENLDIQVRVSPLVPIGMNFVDVNEPHAQLLVIPLPYETSGADRPCFLIEKRANPAAFNLYNTKTQELWEKSHPLPRDEEQ
jgi:hypothetical protein